MGSGLSIKIGKPPSVAIGPRLICSLNGIVSKKKKEKKKKQNVSRCIRLLIY